MPVPFPHSVIYGLPRMKLDGLKAPPYDLAAFDFGHDHGERRYPYIRGASHPWTGMAPESLQFTLYFLNTLEENMFPDHWNKWWAKLQKGEPQAMVHPILGIILVVVRGGSVKLAAQSTSGIEVQVQFATTILDPAEKQDFDTLTVDVKDAAKAVDQALEEWEDLTPALPPVSFLDMIKQIQGFILALKLDALSLIAQVQAYIDGIMALIDLFKADVEDATAGHRQGEARDALLNLWVRLEDMADAIGAEQNRKTGSIVLTADTTLEAFAEAHANKLEEVVSLNVNALATPIVPKGTMLHFYQAA